MTCEQASIDTTAVRDAATSTLEIRDVIEMRERADCTNQRREAAVFAKRVIRRLHARDGLVVMVTRVAVLEARAWMARPAEVVAGQRSGSSKIGHSVSKTPTVPYKTGKSMSSTGSPAMRKSIGGREIAP